MVAQWLRAAASHPDGRRCALRYAGGLAAVQTGWVLRLALARRRCRHRRLRRRSSALELAIPYWAESAGRTPWHPGHIAERYGLFTLIVLGESVLAATVGVQAALDATSTVRRAGTGGGRRHPDRLLHVVDVLRHAGRAGRCPGPDRLRGTACGAPSSGATATTSSSPAPPPPGAGLAVAVDQATAPLQADRHRRPASPSPSRSPSSSLAVWTLHYATKAPGPDADLRRARRRRPHPGVELHARTGPGHRASSWPPMAGLPPSSPAASSPPAARGLPSSRFGRLRRPSGSGAARDLVRPDAAGCGRSVSPTGVGRAPSSRARPGCLPLCSRGFTPAQSGDSHHFPRL